MSVLTNKVCGLLCVATFIFGCSFSMAQSLEGYDEEWSDELMMEWIIEKTLQPIWDMHADIDEDLILPPVGGAGA